MALLLLRHFDRARDVMEYSTDRGVGGVFAGKAGVALDRGFFTEQDTHYYGVFATETGPVAFMNRAQWPLTRSGASSALSPLPDGRTRFVLCIEGVPAYAVTYTRTIDIVDNWSEDETIGEFFSWLHGNLTNDPTGSFFRYYCLFA